MRIQIEDIQLFFDVGSSKFIPDGPKMRELPTLILLHGGPGFDHSMFKPWFDKVSDIVQVIYLDQRGNGRSDSGTNKKLNLNQLTVDLRKFCEALEIEQPIIFGVSFGSWVAVTYAIRYPDKVKKLILDSTSGRFYLDHILTVYERLGGSAAREAARQYFENPTISTLYSYGAICFPLCYQHSINPDIMARYINNFHTQLTFVSSFHTYDILSDLSNIQCQTLVFGGEDDPITPVEDAEELVKLLPSNLVHFERFAKCGHAVFRHYPERYFQILREFILEN